MAERWIEPLGLIEGPAAFSSVRAGQALPLQGGHLAFALARLVEDGAERAILPARAIPGDWQDLLLPLTRRPSPFAGIEPRAPGLPLVMGIVNVTPDSFS